MAGNQKGKGDDRYLWPEMFRVIRELAPRWVLGENVPGILRIAADDACQDLERSGYNVGIFDFEAAAVGAPHRRERIAFVANARHSGYATLISLLCATAKKKTRVTAKERDDYASPKYSMRCLLLTLGMIGDEYKTTRKILLSRLEGNSSYAKLPVKEAV